ncbi:MAG TPA: carboxypeptidase-like regulatory domain-containing protein [Methanocella sp.]|uniref:carboxypeptidase-like regulatory domain-containing protein n=1 Tax=Methanocella sp. TaxID=2052833 RepID=UPI002BF8DD77|nr:carboxypeptidase-like regulatory domain-containing protein [Methanocella sp.]HTY91205.1 carboxypeptidase-like regulatory domain-containing protein [Methanocella sp.]
MFRKALIIAGFLACACFAVAANAQEAQNNTALYWSPVTLEYPCASFTIEDAKDINYSIYDQLGAQSVHVSVITAQLYLNNAPYRMAGIPITFSSDNDSVAYLEPDNRTRPSDASGQAKILLIAHNRTGLVNITAESEIIYGHKLSDTCTVRVVGWGTVSGIVTDQNRNGVPDATVTLWLWNGTANTKMLAAHDNPQLSNDGRTAAIGMYTFVYVPAGSYNVTAEKDGHRYYRLLDMYEQSGTITANVAIPDYVYVSPATLTPTPVATPAASSSASTPVPVSTPALPALFALGAIGAAALMKRRL